MRLDNVPGAAVPYGGVRPEAAPPPRRAEAAVKVKAPPEVSGAAESSQDAGRKADAGELAQAIESVNVKLARVNRRIDIYLIEGTHQVAAKIVDTETNKVVKYIPPEEILELRSRIAEMRGILLNEGA